MGDQPEADLAVADGHDRYVPSEARDIVAAGHEGVYEWAVEHLVADGDRFLDVGCGTGYGSALVTGAGATYDGLDTSPAAIDYAQRRFAHPRARFFLADATEALPPELCPASYDVVFSSEVLEHVADPFGFAEAMAGFVREDGVCFLGTPNRLWSLDHMPSGALMAGSHVMEFTPPALEKMLRTIFADVTLHFRRVPEEAMDSMLPRSDRPRLVRGVLAFAREVSPMTFGHLRRKLDRRSAGREWSSRDIDWLAAGDPGLEPRLCAGLVAVCRGPRR